MKILKIIFLACTCFILLHAKDISNPKIIIEIDSNVISSKVDNNLLYLATDNGLIKIFSLEDNTEIKTLSLEHIQNGFSDELVAPRISNIDVIDDNDLLLVSDDNEAGKALHLFRDGKFTKIFSYKDRMNISKAYFANKDQIVIGLLGNEMMLYDLNTKEFLYKVHPYWSMLTDFILSDDRKIALIGAESGVVYSYMVENGERIKDISLHNDIILAMAFANDILITGGSDKRVTTTMFSLQDSHSLKSDFRVYCVGIRGDGKYGAYVANEQNIINIFDTKTKNITTRLLNGLKNVNVNNIIFINDKEILVTYNSNKILKWEL